jgi:hypothetical protein
MGEKLLDDLARALAEPMPRRRALRLMGSVLVATSFPRAAFARTRRPARSTKCGPDQRVCREFTDEEYCCRSPSWQFFCGAKRGQCLNMCAGGTKFPCTGLISDRFSGINGVCCDRRYHSGCRPDNPRDRLSGGGSRPQCIPCTGKTCGPNKSFKTSDPRRWTCCERPNTCRNGVCRCPDGRTSCGGKKCCKRSQECMQCYDSDSADTTVTGEVKCCGKDELCCINRCCKNDEACCNGRCCPKDTSCARARGRDVCCPDNRTYLARGDREYCCPAGTFPQKGGCCAFGLRFCCSGSQSACPRGQLCVNGECV